MFRWPLQITPLSLGSTGAPREAVLEITPRAAAFTLAALTHVGHAAHLALVDAYLKGQVRLTPTAEIGTDSRTVAASLAMPLIAAAELGIDRLTLANIILLPRDLATEGSPGSGHGVERSPRGQPTRSPDCARLLLRAGESWHWLRGAERFETPGCLGTTRVSDDEPWHDVVAELPDAAAVEASGRAGQWPAPITAEVRPPSKSPGKPDADLVSALRMLALGRFGRSPRMIQRAIDNAIAVTDRTPTSLPLARADLLAERVAAGRLEAVPLAPVPGPADVARALAGPIGARQPALTSFGWHGLTVDVALTPDLDGYQTLCLLPPADVDSATLGPTMMAATRAVIAGLIGQPLAEHRSDPIGLMLRLERDGQEQITTLDVGKSVVIVRNQVVFTAWVGSDGRAMLKLFPPGGMPR